MRFIADPIVPVVGLMRILRMFFGPRARDQRDSSGGYLRRGVAFYAGRLVRRGFASEMALKQYAKLHLRGTATHMLVPATYPVRLEVDKVFVPLLLVDTKGESLDYRDLATLSSARLVVLGDPGSGKSSLMKRVFRETCRRAIDMPRTTPLPVLYELSNLSRMTEVELASLTHETLLEKALERPHDSAIADPRLSVRYLAPGPGYLILLDGLDEVPTHAGPAVLRAIRDLSDHLANASPGSSLIVSTRTQHFLSLEDRALDERFTVLSLRPFTIADIWQFLVAWPYEESKRYGEASRLFARIRRLPSLTEMCTNPLALAMFVARDQQTGGTTTPETRSDFYSALIDELLVNRRSRADDAVGRKPLQELREAILGAVCLGHLLEPDEAANSVPRERFVDAIKSVTASDCDVDDALTRLAIDTGLFSVEREGETFRFLHLTLCEFLAAREILNTGYSAWQEVKDRTVSSPDWSSRLIEVVAFAAGRAPRNLKNQILGDLVNDPYGAVLLRAALEAQTYQEAIRTVIIRESEALGDVPPDDRDAAWFVRLRLLLAVLRDAAVADHPDLVEERRDLPSPARFLTALIDRTGGAEQLLGTLARDDVEAAVAIAESSGPELMSVVAGAADDESVRVALLSRAAEGVAGWKTALCHTALRRTDVARSLALHSSIPDGKPRGQWTGSRLVGQSAYAWLLDEVVSDRSLWPDDDRLLLDHLAHVRPIRFLEDFVLTFPAALVASVFIFLKPSTAAQIVRNTVRRRRIRLTHEGTADSTTPAFDEGIYTQLFPNQRAVLLEVLNLGRFRFNILDLPNADASEGAPRALRAFHIGRHEVEALLLARAMRLRTVRGPAPDSPASVAIPGS